MAWGPGGEQRLAFVRTGTGRNTIHILERGAQANDGCRVRQTMVLLDHVKLIATYEIPTAMTTAQQNAVGLVEERILIWKNYGERWN